MDSSTTLAENATSLDARLQVTKETPEEALKNIDNSGMYDLKPDQYKEVSHVLDSDVERTKRIPAQLGTATAEFLNEDSQQLAASQNSIGDYDDMEKIFTYSKQKIFDIPEKNRRITELSRKEIFDGSITKDEELELEILNQDIEEMESRKPPAIGTTSGLALDVASAAGDIVRMYTDNIGTLASFTFGGGLTGAAIGSVLPGAGTVAGLTGGASTGFLAGSSFVGFKDAFNETTGSTANSLKRLTDDQGQRLNLKKSTIDNVSVATGVVSGLAGALAGKALSSNNPIFKKLSGRGAAAFLSKSPELLKRFDVLGGLAKSAISEGGEEAFQEFVSIFAESFAKLDDSEEGFLNSIGNLTEAISENVANPEAWKQAGYSFVVGAGAGATFQGGSQAVSKASSRVFGGKQSDVQYEREQKRNAERKEVLETQNTLLEIASKAREAKLKGASEKLTNKFVDHLYKAIGSDRPFYLSPEDIEQFASTPEKKAAVDKMLQNNKELNDKLSEVNVDAELSASDTIGIIEQFPELSDVIKAKAEGETPAQVKGNIKEFNDKLEATKIKAEEIVKKFSGDEGLNAEASAELESLVNDLRDARPFEDEMDYVDSLIIAEKDGVVTKEQAENINLEHLAVKLEVSNAIKEEANADFDQVENAILRDVKSKKIKEQIKHHEANLELVDRFAKVDVKTAAEIPGHKVKGFSPNAIDPRTLPEDLRAIYLNDKVLKKRKVFVEGGLSIEESAVMNGVDNGTKLLEILSKTPNKTALKKLKVQQIIGINNDIGQKVKPARKNNLDKAFSKMSNIYVKQLEFVKNNKWSTLKRDVVRIFKKPPTAKQLNQRARVMVDNLKLKNLNPEKFAQGEKKSNKLALVNYLEGKFEQHYSNLEKAALNNELRRESLKSKIQVEKNKEFWKNINSKSNQKALSDAGYSAAIEDLTSIFRLDGNNRGVTTQKKYNEYVKSQVEAGNWTMDIPDHMQDSRLTLEDMTVEQYNNITMKAQSILAQAKMKNKLMNKWGNIAEIRTAEHIAEQIDDQLKNHVNYNEKNAELKSNNLTSPMDILKNVSGTIFSSLSSINSIVKELDAENLGGLFNNIVGDPFNKSLQEKRRMIRESKQRDKAIIEKFYGSVENWRNQFNDTIEVPELKDVIGLGTDKGEIRKVDLFVLQAYRGDSDNINRFENFTRRDGTKLKISDIESILETHLTDKDAAFVQNFMINSFDVHKDAAFAMHEKVTGEKVEAVTGKEFVHRGKVYPGGYFPTSYLPLSDDVKAAKFLESMNKKLESSDLIKEDNKFFAEQRAAEMTRQGQYKNRVGSDRQLDIKFENLFGFREQIVHDLAFREVTMDALKILSNPLNSKNIKSVIGTHKYDVLMDSVKDVASNTTQKESGLFRGVESAVNKTIGHFNKLHAVKVLAFNAKSMIKQLDSFGTLAITLGPKSTMYIGAQFKNMATSPLQYDLKVKQAIEINPDIASDLDNIDDNVIASTYSDFLPSSSTFFTKWKKTGKGINKIKDFQNKYLIETGFTGLREMDKAIRVLSTLAIAEQFNNGDVPGFDLDRLNKMTDVEKKTELTKIVRQTTRNSLTASSLMDKSPLEKSKTGAAFVRYFTDTRSRLNTIFSELRGVKSHFKKGEYKQAVNKYLYLAMISSMSELFMDAVSGYGNEDDEDKDLLDMVMGTSYNFLTAPIRQAIGSLPLISSVKYAIDSPSRSAKRTVNIPALDVAGDLASSIFAMGEMLENGLELEDLTNPQKQRGFIISLGHVAGGFPSKTFNKLIEATNGDDIPDGISTMKNSVNRVNDLIQQYIEKFGDNEEAQPFIEDLKEYRKTLPQDEVSIENMISPLTKPIFKDILSGGKWSKINEETGAAGTYQFTEEQWNILMATEPDLGLTENGRVSKNQDEQEAAMDFTLKENALSLKNHGLEVDSVNLLGSHLYGNARYMEIVDQPDNVKLSTIVGDLASKPPYSSFKTVKNLKDHLSQMITN